MRRGRKTRRLRKQGGCGKIRMLSEIHRWGKDRGMEREKILVSACLLGEMCKYSGESNYSERVSAFLESRGAEAVPVCPEVMGGLSVPRQPAEIRDGRVVTRQGRDVTEEFVRGAKAALEAAEREGCRLAILKERSPSCGSGFIYDGSFEKKLVPGDGIAAGLLKKKGITVIGEGSL